MSEALNAALKDALYLEPEDIEANQDGRISQRQVNRVLGQMRAVWYAVGCLWVVTTAPLVIVGLLVGDAVLQVIVGIFILIWVWGMVRTSLGLRNQHQEVREDLAAGETAWIEGELLKSTRGRRAFYLGIDDLTFAVPQSVYEVAPEGETVVIYYLPRSKQFLSIEVAEGY